MTPCNHQVLKNTNKQSELGSWKSELQLRVHYGGAEHEEAKRQAVLCGDVPKVPRRSCSMHGSNFSKFSGFHQLCGFGLLQHKPNPGFLGLVWGRGGGAAPARMYSWSGMPGRRRRPASWSRSFPAPARPRSGARSWSSVTPAQALRLSSRPGASMRV